MNIRTVILSSAVVMAAMTTNAFAAKKNAAKVNKNLTAQIEAGMQSITEDAARAHVYFLADDLLEGRRAGERGSRIAKQYIISQMRQAGLKPLLGDSYEQPFEACAVQKLKRGVRYYVNADSIANIKKGVYRSMALSNVLAVLPGKKTDEFVVVGAHLDHEGVYNDVAGDKIYNGADDNASGVSAVLQIARAFALSGVQPERNVVFAFWDGEEIGLLGSKYFVQTCPFIPQIKGYLNFDMIGRNNKPENPQHVVYFYTEAHPAFGQWLKDDIKRYGLRLDPNYRPWDKPVGGSDNGSFACKDIPIIWYHTDGHPDYHQPGDEADRINYDKVMNISRAAFLNAWNLANEKTF